MDTACRSSNYEIMRERMAQAFLQYDQAHMIRKFALAHDENYLYLDLLARKHRICRLTGAVTWSEDGFRTEKAADYHAAMTIYDVLCGAKEHCHLSHKWVNVSSLCSIQGGTLRKDGDFFKNSGPAFSGSGAALDIVCRRLGGIHQPKGDVSYELALFPFLPLILRFWEADEEFPASLQALVDRNTLDFLRYETLMFALDYVVKRLNTLCAEMTNI